MAWKVLPCQLGLRSEAEEFCRKEFGKNHREGKEELFTLSKMRSGGSTCEGCSFVTGWWCFAAPRGCTDGRNTLGSVQLFGKDRLKAI